MKLLMKNLKARIKLPTQYITKLSVLKTMHVLHSQVMGFVVVKVMDFTAIFMTTSL